MPEITLPTSPRFKNLKGMKFGRLTVVEYAGKTAGRKHKWKCLCDCGSRSEVCTFTLTSGHTKSCGCYRVDTHTTHGDSLAAEYGIYKAMRSRCQNKNNKHFRNYGGRGISVCERWVESYSAFIEDMGRRPTTGHSIDRIDSNGDYTPDNCRWATRSQQNRNTSQNIMVTHNGATRCLTEWAELLGVEYRLVRRRLNAGWSFEKSITTPKQGVKND